MNFHYDDSLQLSDSNSMPDSLDAGRIATSQLASNRNRIVVDARNGKLKPDLLTVREAFWRPHTTLCMLLAFFCVIFWGFFAWVVWDMVTTHDHGGNMIAVAIILSLVNICITGYLVGQGIGLIYSLIPTFTFYSKYFLARQGWTMRSRSNWQRAVCEPGCANPVVKQAWNEFYATGATKL
jgi:hypothetical protein